MRGAVTAVIAVRPGAAVGMMRVAAGVDLHQWIEADAAQAMQIGGQRPPVTE